MPNFLQRSWVVIALMLALAPAALSQQDQNQQDQQQTQQQQNNQPVDQSTQPIPAYHSPMASMGANGQDQSGSLQPDKRPLSGAQNIGLGTAAMEHSYWQPSFSAFSTVDSNAYGLASGWITYTSLLASLSVHANSSRNEFLLDYAGGGSITTSSQVGNSVLQQIELGDTISLRRASLSFFDDAVYIPEVSFGYSGLGGISLPGAGSLGLSYGFSPEQSILAARDQRLMNTSVGQLNYFLTPRTSLTFVGGYSLLHFIGGGYLDSRNPTAQAGYNYQLTRRDTIALLYRFSDYQFNGLGQSIRDHRADASYGRRITGRLAFQLQAGPEFVSFHTSNSTATPGGIPIVLSSTSQKLWNLESSLNYGIERGGFLLSYAHGVNGGSGILVGAVGDTVGLSATRTLSRQFNGGIRFGYARNKSLNASSQLYGNYNYNYWYTGADLNHPFGRYLSLVVSYQFQHETSNSNLCVGSSCGAFSRNTISVGFTWQDHPIAF